MGARTKMCIRDRAYRIIELVNAERQKRGENVLSVNQELMENAAARAEEACIYFSHTRPDKSKFDTAITVKRYSSAENLAKLYSRDSMEKITEAAVEKWKMCIRDRSFISFFILWAFYRLFLCFSYFLPI